MRRTTLRALAALSCFGLLSSCTDPAPHISGPARQASVAAAVTSIAVLGGADQTGYPNTTLTVPLLIEARDGSGNRVPDQRGTWTILSGGGTVPRTTFRTNANGRTSTRWTLGPSGIQRIRVTVGTASAEFTATMGARFADAALEAAVRAKLGIGPDVVIVDSIAQRLTQLDVTRKGIRSLAGLEFFTALQSLLALENNITDITPIANLTALTVLDLKHNDITSLAALANLSNLDWVSLALNPVSSLHGLENKPNMGSLYVGGNECGITDLSILAAASSLHRLLVHNCPVSSIEPLRGLVNLAVFHIQNSLVTDLSPLANKPLWHLGVPWNPGVSDVSVVATLPLLEEFHAWESDISDISALAGHMYLREVHVSDNPITSLESLRSLRALKMIMADGNRITDISPLVANPYVARGDMVVLDGNYLVSSFVVYPPSGPSYTVSTCGSDSSDTGNLGTLQGRVASFSAAGQHQVECRDTNGDGTPDTPILVP